MSAEGVPSRMDQRTDAPTDKRTVRKRSQGSLRPLHQDARRGTQASVVDHSGGLELIEKREPNSRSNHSTFHIFILVAVVLLSTLLISAYLVQPYIFYAYKSNHSLSSHDSITSSGVDLDHVLHPEDHVHRSPQTLHHEWAISSGLRRPDGVLKRVYLINNEFLGPTIECRSGDRLTITIHNNLGDEGLAMHWHGLDMRGYNSMDGAVGFTQDPIEPGTNFTYSFSISDTQHGTFWYHAHDGVHRADGLWGAFIVHQPSTRGEASSVLPHYDEERLLMVGDWYHRTATDVLDWYMRAASFGNEPVPDSMLLNGAGRYNCSMAVPARPVDCRQIEAPVISLHRANRYRLRLINVGTLSGFTLRVYGAGITPFQVDGGNPIAGQRTAAVGVLHPGQRLDLLVEPDVSTQLPKIEIELDRASFKYPNPALAAMQSFDLFLSGDSQEGPPSAALSKLQRFDLDSVQPSASSRLDLPDTVNETLVLYSTSVKLAHLGNVPHGFLNQTSWKPQSSPPGNLLSLSRDQWDEHQFVPQIPFSLEPGSGYWVDLVLNNLDDGSHPFHLHGYDVWVLQTHAGFGWGSWNPFSTKNPPGGPLNTRNPMKRDTVVVPKRGYTVLRFKADNPGIWMLHCHILWHQSSGMAMGLQIG